MQNTTLSKRPFGESAEFERQVRERVEREPKEEFVNLNLQKVDNSNEETGPLFIYNPTTKNIKNILGEFIGKRYGPSIVGAGEAYNKFYNSTEFVNPDYVKRNRENWKLAVRGEIKPYYTPYLNCSSRKHNSYCSIFLFNRRNSEDWYDGSMNYFFDGFSDAPRGVKASHEFDRAEIMFDNYSTIYEAPPEIAGPYLEFLGMVGANNPTVMTLYALQNLPVELDANTVFELEEFMGNSNALIGGKRRKRKSKRKCRRSRKRRTRRHRF